MKKSFIVFVLILTFFIFPKKIQAITISISDAPSSISQTEPFTIAVLISGSSEGTNYLRVDLYKDGTSNYFGETHNGSSWYGESDYSQYFPITIPWSGQIQGRFGNPAPIKYDGQGQYKLKIRRYTASGKSYDFSEAVNIVIETLSTPTAVPTATATPTPPTIPTPITIPLSLTPTNPVAALTPTAVPISYNNIYLSEFMAYPETDQNEWVELYNANNFTVYLVNWYIDDIENAGSSPKIFSKEIPALGYAVFELSSAVFNNDEDNVRLLDFNSILKDSFSYKDATKGKSFGRVFPANDFCLQMSSKGIANTLCLNETPAASPTSSPTSTPTKTPTPAPVPLPTIQPTIILDEKVSSLSSFISQSDYFMPFSAKNSKPAEVKNNVLGVKSNNTAKPVFYIKTLSLSSFFISLLNILYILNKIRKISKF